jgi:hypothetical protein
MARYGSSKAIYCLKMAIAILIGTALLVGVGTLARRKAENNKITHVVTELMAFSSVMGNFDSAGQPPPNALAQAVVNDDTKGLRYIRSGVDPWGSPFYYRVTAKRSTGYTAYEVTVRSFGSNRIDEGGKGDDFENVYHVTVFDETEG